jgi:hypothetical protein
VIGTKLKLPSSMIERCMMPRVRWRDILGWEGVYRISSRGQVKRIVKPSNSSLVWNQDDKILRPKNCKGGYLAVKLSWRDKAATVQVHQLVAAAFLPPKPPGRMEVNHLDGNKHNNAVENLTWTTSAENKLHASRTGLAYRGDLNGQSKVTWDMVRAARRSFLEGAKIEVVRAGLGLSLDQTKRILSGESWVEVDDGGKEEGKEELD